MANSSEGKVVALYTSAWIEITCSRKPFSEYTVALYTSAWIEINLFDPKDQIITVALYTSAWIEITFVYQDWQCPMRCTLHECVD